MDNPVSWSPLIDMVNAFMAKENLSISEMAEKAGISQPQLSKILNGKSAPGVQSCNKLAHAMRMPADTVQQAAGLMPRRALKSILVDQAMYLFEQLEPEDQESWLRMLEAYHAQKTEKRSRTT